MAFKYKLKKTQTSKTQRKRREPGLGPAKRERERDCTPFIATAKLLSAVSPPLSRRLLGGSASLFNLGMFFFFFFLLLTSCYLNLLRTFIFFKSPCANFYCRNSCFGLISGLGLYEILGFLLSPCAFHQLLHLSMP